jgi:hypothetical protein
MTKIFKLKPKVIPMTVDNSKVVPMFVNDNNIVPMMAEEGKWVDMENNLINFIGEKEHE